MTKKRYLPLPLPPVVRERRRMRNPSSDEAAPDHLEILEGDDAMCPDSCEEFGCVPIEQ